MNTPARKSRIFRFTGIALILIGLAGNPWILAALFSPDNALTRTTRFEIILLETVCVALGVQFLRQRHRVSFGFQDIRRFYIGTALLVFNTLLIFALLNLIAYFLMPAPGQIPLNYITVEEKLRTDRQFYHGIFHETSDSDIVQLLHPPNITAHPTLEFMEHPTVSRHYNVGIENMRYTRFVTAANARTKIDGATWVLGGSTTFGHGIGDDSTIPAYLNELDSSTTYINFGVQAYHQNLEIDKLLTLLKKGYRPKRVIFIDGLNDIEIMSEMNFRPEETPSRLYDAYHYLANIEGLRNPDKEFLLRRFPLFDLLYSMLDRGKERGFTEGLAAGYDDLDNPGSLYHVHPLLHYDLMSRTAADYDLTMTNIALYENKIISYYEMNDEYLEQLSKAFGFEYTVFFQPAGNMSPANPFHRDPAHFRDDARYRYFKAMADAVREAIRKGELAHFCDISDADKDNPACYVDLTHYGPALCRDIARTILTRLSSLNQSLPPLPESKPRRPVGIAAVRQNLISGPPSSLSQKTVPW